MLQRQEAFQGTDRAESWPPDAPRVLSRRQQQVLELLAEGVPAREIATTLGIAEATARNHIRLILHKLGCHSQLQAVATAVRLGLLRRDAPDAGAR
jgi:DNA-binding NarL/FixJ family response regulator